LKLSPDDQVKHWGYFEWRNIQTEPYLPSSSMPDYTEVNARLKAACWLDKGITECNSKCSI